MGLRRAERGPRNSDESSVPGWARFVLQHARAELRGDRNVVMKAVSQYGYALEYATDELRGDREVVKA